MAARNCVHKSRELAQSLFQSLAVHTIVVNVLTDAGIFEEQRKTRIRGASPFVLRTNQVLNQELKEANSILLVKRNEVRRIEKEVALLMQVTPLCELGSRSVKAMDTASANLTI